jgi:hypothetical protein
VGISPEAQSGGGGGGGGTFAVKALEGERREIDGCQRVVRIRWELNTGQDVWVDYSALLDEENWTDVEEEES